MNENAQQPDESLLQPVSGPELVFGLVGPIGTDLQLVGEILTEELERVRYESALLRVSQIMHQLIPDLPDDGPEDERYVRHMNAGNEIRKKLGRGDALALVTAGAIGNMRRTVTGDDKTPAPRRAYVVRSLKHPEEVETLHKIYGRAFFLIAAYAPRDARKEKLAESIARSKSETDKTRFLPRAEELIIRDEEETENKLGQRVRDTFPLADVFVVATDRSILAQQIRRFVQIVFEHPFQTPTIDEFVMFHARAAALRSSDLSRQVGAAIADNDGSILGVGCNEVPKFGGGAYWAGDEHDRRDFQLGYDPSTVFKERMLAEVLNRLLEGGWLAADKKASEIRALVADALGGGANPLMQGARLMDLLEFGRIVHAEMAAVADASRRGVALKGSRLFCTTFPCHMCARHLVAVGISEVIYIEPYPKSLAKELYPDSISVDDRPDSQRVCFTPFVGVSPNRFIDLFTKPKRKSSDGKALNWKETAAVPRLKRFVHSYILIEQQVSVLLKRLLERKDLKTKGE
jgi:deoxycytidylate deaminase